MDEVTMLVRELGPTGIIALALLIVSRNLRPTLEGIVRAQKDSADARREQSETNKAVLRRWGESDDVLESHSRAFVDAMHGMTEQLRDLKITDTQRVKQNDVIHGVISGLRTDVSGLPTLLDTSKNDAVDKVNKAMDDKLKPIEQTLHAIQKQVGEALALLHSVTAERAPLQTQEHHHSGSVTVTPGAVEPGVTPSIEKDEPK